MSLSKKVISVTRDIILFGGLVFLISLWQEKDLLDSDGSITIENRNLVSLAGNSEPLLVNQQRTLIYFFAPWCKICSVSIGNLDGIDDPDLRIVKVALDYGSKDEVEQFVRENNVKGNVLLGTRDMLQEFNVPGFPTYYYLDSQKNVVANGFGYSTEIGLRLQNFFNSP